MQARDPPWLWNPGETSPEVQTEVSVAPRKALMSSKNFKKKKKRAKNPLSDNSLHWLNTSVQTVVDKSNYKQSCLNKHTLPNKELLYIRWFRYWYPARLFITRLTPQSWILREMSCGASQQDLYGFPVTYLLIIKMFLSAPLVGAPTYSVPRRNIRSHTESCPYMERIEAFTVWMSDILLLSDHSMYTGSEGQQVRNLTGHVRWLSYSFCGHESEGKMVSFPPLNGFTTSCFMRMSQWQSRYTQIH